MSTARQPSELVYRHNRVTRLSHWITVLALPILFMSGLQIFNAHPILYWGHTSDPGSAFMSISSEEKAGHERGYVELFGQRIDTTGLLGVQRTKTGTTQQAFPGWLTVPSYFWLAGGRHWHFFFAWVFFLNGLLYVIFNLLNGHMRKFFLTPRDAAKIPAMALYYLRLRKETPQEGEYNPLQKIAYTGVFFALTPLIMLSGMAMSPQLNQAFHSLPAMFGGRQSARTIHFILTFGFAAFVFGHVFMVLTTGVVNNMRSMLTGWYREKVMSIVEPPPKAAVQPAEEIPAAAEAARESLMEHAAPPAQEEKAAAAEPNPAAARSDEKKTGGENDSK